jgi:hypothetical protein
MNKIIKVYGHHRSGNNYLCALLYKNFYSGMESMARTIDRGERRFVLFGEEDRTSHRTAYTSYETVMLCVSP